MASRFPSGQDEPLYYQSSYTRSTNSSYYPKSRHPTTYSSSIKTPTRSSAHSPPPPASNRYIASQTFTNRNSHVTERAPLPDHSHAYVTNSTHKNRGSNTTSPRYQQSTDTYRGKHKSPRGRHATPPSSEYRHESARVSYRSSENSSSWSKPNNRDQSNSRYTQTDWGTSHTNYRSNSNSNPYTHTYPSYTQRTPSSSKRDPIITRNTTYKYNKHLKKDQILTPTPQQPLTKKGENKQKSESITKEQCSICLNDVKDKVSLKCDHSFCYECLVKWCATKETCPLCRCKISELNEINKSLPSQRMIATFVCECGNVWKSKYAYNGITQGCKKCKREVVASNQRPLMRVSNPVNSFLGMFPLMREKESSHKQELCGMCKLLGKDCSRQDTLGEDDDLLDLEGLENLMAYFSLTESGLDNGLIETDWSSPFSEPEDFVREELGVDLDLYDPLFDDYVDDFDLYSLDDMDQIDWAPDWENI
ncbi:hypothetical protein LOD99_5604 [Oopsacas minuta]|uniref:RING-type domain-containing protein n=1 Tax=Oopsacas minuta TaxID=111878 RepID=A0AAV7JQE3_9METZ|nr:hypothetical protein LOD99_5604 [Oopsacas minuta]